MHKKIEFILALAAGIACGTTLSACTDEDSYIKHGCGNKVIEEYETCDDGNLEDGDGCNSECQVEDNFACDKIGGPCHEIECGDRFKDGEETCDDGNTENGDGCSSECIIENGYICPDAGSACLKEELVCGNGHKEAREACDDGNLTDGDGCSKTCTIENGYICPEAGKLCQKDDTNTEIPTYTPNPGPQTQCGDNKFEAGEICELGMTGMTEDMTDRQCINKDGRCVLESIEGEKNCGNGVLEDDEECDDGNKINKGDGCSTKCKLQPDICKLQNGSAAKVLLAADGDTLKLRVLKDGNCTTESTVTVRMHGIDCPECAKDKTTSSVDSSYEAQACSEALSSDYSDKTKNEKGGYEAWEFVNTLLASVDYDVKVGCETVSDTNPVCLADATLGRFLAYIGIEKDGQSIDLAQEIIRAGYGMAYTQFTSQRIEAYCEAENIAREAKAGVWSYGDTLEQIVNENFDAASADAYLLDPNHCQ
jgi:cysteine-rich repeat protein